jgi:hypothetical protein
LIGLVDDLDRQAGIDGLDDLRGIEEDDVGIAVLQEGDRVDGCVGGQELDLDAELFPDAEALPDELRIDRAARIVRRQEFHRVERLRRHGRNKRHRAHCRGSGPLSQNARENLHDLRSLRSFCPSFGKEPC